VDSSTRRDGRRVGRMEKRRTSLEDGRYLIYYTFDESGPAQTNGPEEAGAASPAESEAKPEAAEERSV
jgi:hypothetical protein